MANFMSKHAEALLRAHQPGQFAFHLAETGHLAEAGLTQDAAGAARADDAYQELLQLGYVEESPTMTVMPYSGGMPRKPYKLTEAGIRAKPAEPGAVTDGGRDTGS